MSLRLLHADLCVKTRVGNLRGLEDAPILNHHRSVTCGYIEFERDSIISYALIQVHRQHTKRTAQADTSRRCPHCIDIFYPHILRGQLVYEPCYLWHEARPYVAVLVLFQVDYSISEVY